jgi:hypothetical protein
MKQDLYDMLQAAKADAPPLQHSVDDIVAGGRRLQGRRRTLMAGGASAAVVLAVAGAVVVPQAIAGRTEAPAQTAAVASTPARPKPEATPRPKPGWVMPVPTLGPPTGQPFSYPQGLFEYGYQGYTVGNFEIFDPQVVTPGYQESTVRKKGEMEDLWGDGDSIVASGPASTARLTVYRPGVFQPSRFKGQKSVTVAGRPGYFAKDLTYQPGANQPHPRPALAWQYADNAWATLHNQTPSVYSEKDLLTIAGGFGGSPARGATLAFRVSWVPAGYALTSTGTSDDYPNGALGMLSSTRFIKGSQSFDRLTHPISAEDSKASNIRVALWDTHWTDSRKAPSGQAADSAFCNPGNKSLCYRMIDDGKYMIEVYSTGDESSADLRKIADGLTLADVENPATWFPVTEAVPAIVE